MTRYSIEFNKKNIPSHCKVVKFKSDPIIGTSEIEVSEGPPTILYGSFTKKAGININATGGPARGGKITNPMLFSVDPMVFFFPLNKFRSQN